MNSGFGVSEAIEDISRVAGNCILFQLRSMTTHPKQDHGTATESMVNIHGIKELGNNLALKAYLRPTKSCVFDESYE